MLVLLVLLVAHCWAQTVVYTTGPNGEVSAYLIVGNSTNITDSSSTSYSSSSGSPASVSASTTSSPSITTSSSTDSPVAVVLPTTPYTGQSLLTGTCTIPQYTALHFADGSFIEVPLIGCSDDRPECCPSLAMEIPVAATTATLQDSDSSTTVTSPSLTPTGVISMLSEAPLTVCPSDMVDIDPVCCPSGFTKWGQAILGNTPCASLLSTSYAVPSSLLVSITSAVAASATLTTSSSNGSPAPEVMSQSVTIIVNQVFAIGLPCADEDETDEEKHGLSTGAKAGIGVGVGLGVLLLGVLGIWACFRVRRHKKTNSEVPREAPTATPVFPVESKTGAVASTEQMSPTFQATGYPTQTAQNFHWMGPAHSQDPGYGHGFVDGVKAALSPYGSPPQSPPPFYGVQRTGASYPPAEVPAESMRQERPADRAAELSASDTNTRSSVA